MGHAIRVLIVDDEGRFLNAIAARLAMRGFEVRTAADGPAAVEIARQEKFDLALVDLKMPGMDGNQVLKALKGEHQHLEGIILTGHGSLESLVDIGKQGTEGYLPKPFELEQLLEAILQTYSVRLRKKFAANSQKLDEIARLATGRPPLAALKALRELDDEER